MNREIYKFWANLQLLLTNSALDKAMNLLLFVLLRRLNRLLIRAANKDIIQGFHYIFVQEVSGVFSFSY